METFESVDGLVELFQAIGISKSIASPGFREDLLLCVLDILLEGLFLWVIVNEASFDTFVTRSWVTGSLCSHVCNSVGSKATTML